METKHYFHDAEKNLNIFFSFRHYVCCLNRMNVYVRSHQKQFGRNVYMRVRPDETFEVFLPAYHDLRSDHFVIAVYEAVEKKKKPIVTDENKLKFDLISTEKRHLKNIIDSDEPESVLTWFDHLDKNVLRKRKLNDDVPLDKIKKPKHLHVLEYEYGPPKDVKPETDDNKISDGSETEDINK